MTKCASRRPTCGRRRVTLACPGDLTRRPHLSLVPRGPPPFGYLGPTATLPSLQSGDGLRYGDVSHEPRGRVHEVEWHQGSHPALAFEATQSTPQCDATSGAHLEEPVCAGFRVISAGRRMRRDLLGEGRSDLPGISLRHLSGPGSVSACPCLLLQPTGRNRPSSAVRADLTITKRTVRRSEWGREEPQAAGTKRQVWTAKNAFGRARDAGPRRRCVKDAYDRSRAPTRVPAKRCRPAPRPKGCGSR